MTRIFSAIVSIVSAIILLFVLNIVADIIYAPTGVAAVEPAAGKATADKAAVEVKTKKVAEAKAPVKVEPAKVEPKKPEPKKAEPAKVEKTAAVAAAPKKRKKRHPGKRLYLRKTCMACHGKGGARAIQNYPNLAGQAEKYIITQVKDILSGKRVGSVDENGTMRTSPMTGSLITAEGKIRITDDEIQKIANWLSTQPSAKPVPLETALGDEQLAQAKSLYKKKCKACHGKGALKPLKNYPILAGMKKAYIVAQINDVKNKVRKNGKIKSMVPFVKKLNDEQIDLLASYLSQIVRIK